jgi:hypothetical protein
MGQNPSKNPLFHQKSLIFIVKNQKKKKNAPLFHVAHAPQQRLDRHRLIVGARVRLRLWRGNGWQWLRGSGVIRKRGSGRFEWYRLERGSGSIGRVLIKKEKSKKKKCHKKKEFKKCEKGQTRQL